MNGFVAESFEAEKIEYDPRRRHLRRPLEQGVHAIFFIRRLMWFYEPQHFRRDPLDSYSSEFADIVIPIRKGVGPVEGGETLIRGFRSIWGSV